MARVKNSVATRARRKKILNQAEGYFGSKHLLFKTAKEQVLHGYNYAYVSRRDRKSDYRKLWIKRINAACRMNGLSYSQFINGLTKAGVLSKENGGLNRKMLSEMAINDPKAFANLCDMAKKALA
ncbi:MAG: 50S ribosomal protein L20 [Erysipelotrichaceae bacterium]|nr:50S ribosomal protein L20 [Erysipelotrichaceae bacterium]